MKQFYFILVALLVNACLDNSPEFLSPQPSDKKNLKQFPGKLRGKYYIDRDKSLTIYRYHITQQRVEELKTSLNDISTDTNLFLKNDTLFDKASNEKVAVTLKNDSAFGYYEWIDTAFFISEKHLLRKYRKCYLLNERTKDSLWKVVKLEKTGNSEITFSVISMKAEAISVRKYTDLINPKIKKDTIVNFSLDPAKDEFIKMLSAEDLFTDKEVYRKVQ